MSSLRTPRATIGLLTLVVAAVALQTLDGRLLPAWQWDAPAVMRGEVWRMFTGALVHSHGWSQIAFNLTGLVLIGWLVEQQWSRRAWALAATAGIAAGELSAVWWHPVGGGISVALGGLVGLAVVGWLIDPRLPAWFRFGLPALYLAGATYVVSLSDIHGPPLFAGAGVGLAMRGDRRLPMGSLIHG